MLSKESFAFSWLKDSFDESITIINGDRLLTVDFSTMLGSSIVIFISEFIFLTMSDTRSFFFNSILLDTELKILIFENVFENKFRLISETARLISEDFCSKTFKEHSETARRKIINTIRERNFIVNGWKLEIELEAIWFEKYVTKQIMVFRIRNDLRQLCDQENLGIDLNFHVRNITFTGILSL
jgi:hypothetical protein